MRKFHQLILSSILVLTPVAALAQSNATSTTAATAGSESPGTSTSSSNGESAGAASSTTIPPSQNGTGTNSMVRSGSPDSAAAQQQNPAGGQPGTGSGMGKVSGTAAGN